MTLLDTKEGREDLIWALTQAATYPAFVAGLLEPSPGLPVYTQRTLRECFAFAPGRWLAVHGASCLDGSHVAVQHSEPNAKKGAKKP